MKKILKLVSFIGLGLTLVPSFLVATQLIPWQLHTCLMLAGTLLWFATAPFWMQEGTE
jgi:hypothetical protein